jgi:3-oxoacyl-[acyl-carrier-protein] synthase II
MKGVVLTGLGVVSPLGQSADTLLAGLLEGRVAARPVTRFEASPFPCTAAATVPDFDPKAWVENRKNLRLMTPAVLYGLAAVKLALQDAALPPGSVDPERLGLFVGAGTAFGELGDLVPAVERGRGADGGWDPVRFAQEGMPIVNPLWLLKGLSNNVLGYASAQHDARGINQNYCNTGVGALQALGEAAWALAEGRADVLVAGGADSAVNPEHFTGFGRLGVLSNAGHTRPFDARHDGFVPGEGAAFFVLEREEVARSRGARVLARVCGYGTATGLKGLSGADPTAVEAALRRALEVADWAPESVDVVQAHGNANPLFDRVESEVFGRVFGGRSPVIAADKGQLGHALAAAGALSTAALLVGMRAGRIPPVGGLDEVDAPCRGLDLVKGTPREVSGRRGIVHAAGLGGQTAMLALEIER